MKTEIKEASVCIIENPKGQILLLQRTLLPHGMCLPGGKVDMGETAVDACCREAFEETKIMLPHSQIVFLGKVESALNDYVVNVFYHKLDPADESFRPTKVILAPREHIGYAWTELPEHGFQLAGNTDKMLELWRNHKSN